MRTDRLGEDGLDLDRGNPRSSDSTVMEAPVEIPAEIAAEIAGEQPEDFLAKTIAAPTVEPVAVTPSEPAKACCICGLDISHKTRSRDRAGRYWCVACQQFDTGNDKSPGSMPCPDCARDTRISLMVQQHAHGDTKVCRACNQIFITDRELALKHKQNVTTDPELAIHALIRRLFRWMGGLILCAILIILYHFGLLDMYPKPWVPFLLAVYPLGIAAVALAGLIIAQYPRMAIRKRERLYAYDQMVKLAMDHVVTLYDDSHTMGISESSETLHSRIERAITRVQACAGCGVAGAGEIIDALAKKADATRLIDFLLAHRPGAPDIVARNREIATLSFLQGTLDTTLAAVTAILLRIPHDQDAMTRQGLVCFRRGELEESKKIFRRVVHIARERNSDIDLASAYCNLGMLHVMLEEYDDAANRYNQALTIYKRLNHDRGQAECLVNLCLIAYRQKKGAEVEAQFYKAMQMNQKCNRREGIAVCCSMLGMILYEKEIPQLKQAEKLLNNAIRLNLELGRAVGVATAYGNLGLVRVKKGDLAGARELFIKAQSIYQRINRPKMVAKIQGMLKTVGNISTARARA